MFRETNPSVTRYKARVKDLPLLDRETELALARRWKEGRDFAARDELARVHLRSVVATALKYRRYGLEVSDLIAEGNVGLLHALDKFDPERGVRLVTYASHWIRAYVLDSILRSWSMVGGGAALRTKLFFKLRREQARAKNLVGEGEASERLLVQRLGIDQERLRGMLQQIELRDLHLDHVLVPDSDMRWIDALPAPDRSQEEVAMNRETVAHARVVVQSALDALDRRERFIVEQRLMADPEDELSLAEIARALGFSRERARQLEVRARHKLRAHIVHIESARGQRRLAGAAAPLRSGSRAA
jgi:RNA polymerase sigma-32 factor